MSTRISPKTVLITREQLRSRSVDNRKFQRLVPKGLPAVYHQKQEPKVDIVKSMSLPRNSILNQVFHPQKTLFKGFTAGYSKILRRADNVNIENLINLGAQVIIDQHGFTHVKQHTEKQLLVTGRTADELSVTAPLQSVHENPEAEDETIKPQDLQFRNRFHKIRANWPQFLQKVSTGKDIVKYLSFMVKFTQFLSYSQKVLDNNTYNELLSALLPVNNLRLLILTLVQLVSAPKLVRTVMFLINELLRLDFRTNNINYVKPILRCIGTEYLQKLLLITKGTDTGLIYSKLQWALVAMDVVGIGEASLYEATISYANTQMKINDANASPVNNQSTQMNLTNTQMNGTQQSMEIVQSAEQLQTQQSSQQLSAEQIQLQQNIQSTEQIHNLADQKLQTTQIDQELSDKETFATEPRLQLKSQQEMNQRINQIRSKSAVLHKPVLPPTTPIDNPRNNSELQNEAIHFKFVQDVNLDLNLTVQPHSLGLISSITLQPTSFDILQRYTVQINSDCQNLFALVFWEPKQDVNAFENSNPQFLTQQRKINELREKYELKTKQKRQTESFQQKIQMHLRKALDSVDFEDFLQRQNTNQKVFQELGEVEIEQNSQIQLCTFKITDNLQFSFDTYQNSRSLVICFIARRNINKGVIKSLSLLQFAPHHPLPNNILKAPNCVFRKYATERLLLKKYQVVPKPTKMYFNINLKQIQKPQLIKILDQNKQHILPDRIILAPINDLTTDLDLFFGKYKTTVKMIETLETLGVKIQEVKLPNVHNATDDIFQGVLEELMAGKTSFGTLGNLAQQIFTEVLQEVKGNENNEDNIMEIPEFQSLLSSQQQSVVIETKPSAANIAKPVIEQQEQNQSQEFEEVRME
ncbi:Conserved_hypothetical protein [Hexamita inflata]|uniref:Uncharacterized protein n=1 Tax=Hexamita inflata TaxID=28002 RepID=A0ABP1HJP6_9EUKA